MNPSAATDGGILTRAAELLETDAELTRQSCAIGEKYWVCDCKRDQNGDCAAQRDYRERIKVAGELRKAA